MVEVWLNFLVFCFVLLFDCSTIVWRASCAIQYWGLVDLKYKDSNRHYWKGNAKSPKTTLKMINKNGQSNQTIWHLTIHYISSKAPFSTTINKIWMRVVAFFRSLSCRFWWCGKIASFANAQDLWNWKWKNPDEVRRKYGSQNDSLFKSWYLTNWLSYKLDF